MAEEIAEHGGAIKDMDTCCKNLVSSAEIDQQISADEMNEITTRYETLKASVNARLEKDGGYKDKIDKFHQIDEVFGNWLETAEAKVAKFEPIILEEDFLVQNLQEARVRKLILISR